MRMNKELLRVLDASDRRVKFLSEIKKGSIGNSDLEKLVQSICDAPENGPTDLVNKDISYIIALLHVVHFSSKKAATNDDRKSANLDELYSLLAVELACYFQ